MITVLILGCGIAGFPRFLTLGRKKIGAVRPIGRKKIKKTAYLNNECGITAATRII